MFTWICPVCGAEVPPSESECPRCAERRRAAMTQQPGAAPAYTPPGLAPAAPAAMPQGMQPAAPTAPPQPPQAPPAAYGPTAPPTPAPPQQVYVIGNQNPRRGVPAWLAASLTIAVLGGGLFALYRYIARGGSGQTGAGQATTLERPTAQTSQHPFAKYVEVTGIRLLETADKKLVARFVVVNHAPAPLSGFRLRVTLEASNASPGEAVIAVVDASPGTLPPHGIREVEAPLVTHLKVYELPDWQFLRARVEILDAK